MSDEQETPAVQDSEQPPVVEAPPVAEPQATPAAEPSVESGSVTAEEAAAATAAPGADEQRQPAQPEPQPGTAEAESGANEQAPPEGYDPDEHVFVKQFNLASATLLHQLDADALAEHPQTAGLPEAATRAALELGYKPTGPAQLVHGEPDGAKSALSYAVPVEPRPAPTASFAPAPFQERPQQDAAEPAPAGE